VLFFKLSTLALALGLLAFMVGCTLGGYVIGRSARRRSETVREPFAVMQATLLGFMGLVLAFALSLAVGRYEARRQAVVTEADAIGTTYLRAQTLPEPMRTRSMQLLASYTDAAIKISDTIPGSEEQQRALATSTALQGQLWAVVGDALAAQPVASAPKLYVESLNDAFDSQTERVYGLANRVPTPVLLLEILGAGLAVGALALHLGSLGRGIVTVLVAALLVTSILVVTFDLDRPTRGLITVPDTALVETRASMGQ